MKKDIPFSMRNLYNSRMAKKESPKKTAAESC